MKFSIALVSLPSSFKTDTALFTYQIKIIEYTQDIHQLFNFTLLFLKDRNTTMNAKKYTYFSVLSWNK